MGSLVVLIELPLVVHVFLERWAIPKLKEWGAEQPSSAVFVPVPYLKRTTPEPQRNETSACIEIFGVHVMDSSLTFPILETRRGMGTSFRRKDFWDRSDG